ncbi:unnamed protein product [Prorocentrum cordatum]|uniref:Uncharacterized protein n=1 Tax=Prorocentrum cordatum TaxID=2364126 RepID=A0ABN9XXQ0_9DINO|nr:unnamed protein product [Polarella glacialis]
MTDCVGASEGPPSWANQLMSIQVTDSVQGATSAAEALLRAAAMDASNMIPEEKYRKEDESAPPTPIEEMLAKASEEKKLPTEANSEFNRWWAKELAANTKLKQNYKLVGRGYEAQRKFKIDWAGQRSVQMKEERTKTSEYRQVDGMRGEYLPLSIHVKKEGNDAMAFIAVQNYVKNIATFVAQGKTYKGRPWIVFDKLYNRVKFLRIQEYFDDSNQESWSKTTHLLDEGSRMHSEAPSRSQATVASSASAGRAPAGPAAPPALPAPPAPEAAATGPPEVPEQKRRRVGTATAAKSEAKGLGKVKAQPEDDSRAAAKSFKTVVAEAMKIKQKMEKVSTAASDLLQAITTQKEWHWANNDANLKDLTTQQLLLGKLKTKDKFWCAWTVQSDWAKNVKVTYSEPTIESNLQEGLPAMQTAINDLNAQITLLKDMHQARQNMMIKRSAD